MEVNKIIFSSSSSLISSPIVPLRFYHKLFYNKVLLVGVVCFIGCCCCSRLLYWYCCSDAKLLLTVAGCGWRRRLLFIWYISYSCPASIMRAHNLWYGPSQFATSDRWWGLWWGPTSHCQQAYSAGKNKIAQRAFLWLKLPDLFVEWAVS